MCFACSSKKMKPKSNHKASSPYKRTSSSKSSKGGNVRVTFGSKKK